MAVKIALDAGHGLKTAGKRTPDGIREWTLNDKVRDKVVKLLADYDVQIIHLDNNEGNVDESLASRYQRYMKAGVKLVVSIHHNALKSTWSNATGVEVWVDKNPTSGDLKLANLIYKKMVKYTGLKGRGIKKEAFYVINQNKITAVLCEGGFMDGKKDYKVITSDAGQTAYAKAVAEGIVEYLGLKKKVSKPKTKYYARYNGTSVSIVTALNSIKVTSSFANRKKIAKANGISLYVGTASQNTKLLNLLKKGKLIKP